MMSKQFLKESFGWGFILWFFGYVLGIALFFVLPVSLIGWIILPIGVFLTLWVLFKKIKSVHFTYYLGLAFVWTLLAVLGDYLFIVQAIHPPDGYYKLDVYLYYILIFFLPLIAGWWRKNIVV